MRILMIISFFFLTPVCIGQVYTSPITQHFPSFEMEKISRVINFEEETITISSKTARGEDVQVFRILQKENSNIDPIGEATLYTCTSLDWKFTTYLILPKDNNPEFIDAIQPSQLQQKEKQYRFILEAPDNDVISQ